MTKEEYIIGILDRSIGIIETAAEAHEAGFDSRRLVEGAIQSLTLALATMNGEDNPFAAKDVDAGGA